MGLRSGGGGGGIGALLVSGKDGAMDRWDAQADGGELEQRGQEEGEVERSHFENAGVMSEWRDVLCEKWTLFRKVQYSYLDSFRPRCTCSKLTMRISDP